MYRYVTEPEESQIFLCIRIQLHSQKARKHSERVGVTVISFKHNFHCPEGEVSYMGDSEDKGQILRERQVIRTEKWKFPPNLSSTQNINYEKSSTEIMLQSLFFF